MRDKTILSATTSQFAMIMATVSDDLVPEDHDSELSAVAPTITTSARRHGKTITTSVRSDIRS